eukprot:3494430-Rhodomonas_salina.1
MSDDNRGTLVGQAVGNRHATLAAAVQNRVICWSSVGVHGTTPAEYRKTDTMPNRTASMAWRGSMKALRRWATLSSIERQMYLFSYLQSPVSVRRTPRNLKGLSGANFAKEAPR